MGKRLSQYVTITENNETCVVLKVKKNSAAGLVALGPFDGTETMFRLTKGRQHTCTLWKKDGSPFSWDWGEDGYTLVSDGVAKMGRLVEDAITSDFGIYIGSDLNKVRRTLHKTKPKPKAETMVAMWWGGQSSIVVHRHGEFWKSFRSHEAFLDHVKAIGGVVKGKSEDYHAPTGCLMRDYTVLI